MNEKISKEKFTPAEDRIILNLFKIHGKQWRHYIKHLPNRSYIKIKNRCLSLFKKQIKRDLKANKNVNNNLILKTKTKINSDLESNLIKTEYTYQKSQNSGDSQLEIVLSIDDFSLN